jgi:hypothetical protein
MYQCEYWSCIDDAAVDSAVCLDHEVMFKSGGLNDCQLCDQLKETEFALCGACESLSVSGSLLEFDVGESRNEHIEWVDDGW